jgi:hypothetical protein
MTAPPPPVGSDAGDYAPRSGSELALPPVLREYVAGLESWTRANARDARWDSLRFWGLKLPAIFASGAAGVLGLLNLPLIAAIAAGIGTVCVLVDSLNPGGQLRNAHLRAVHDLRNLQSHVLTTWRVGVLRGEHERELAASILADAEEGRVKIAEELQAAETMLDAKRS